MSVTPRPQIAAALSNGCFMGGKPTTGIRALDVACEITYKDAHSAQRRTDMSDQPITRAEDYAESNLERLKKWAIDPSIDPQDLPLGQIDPGHPELFEAGRELPYFERLRREDPVHFCEQSQFGPY